MSERPIFKPIPKGENLVETINVEFTWFSGLSKSQKQKSIRSLHEEATKANNLNKILEISSKSEEEMGVRASAFYIAIRTKKGLHTSMESLYQGSKVFENGGPFVDLYSKNSLDSKKDRRLQSSGNLKGFNFEGEYWGLDEHFYDWLYLKALIQNNEIAEKIFEYDAFTDIEFNPKKSFSCQLFN